MFIKWKKNILAVIPNDYHEILHTIFLNNYTSYVLRSPISKLLTLNILYLLFCNLNATFYWFKMFNLTQLLNQQVLCVFKFYMKGF